jgi:Uma2 family endonuclease
VSMLVAESESKAIACRPRTVADLLEELGQIPAERIRLQPAPGTATEEDLFQTRRCELIDGTLVERAMGFFESRLAFILGYLIEQSLKQNPIGFTTVGGDAYTRLEGVGIRVPDVAVYFWTQFPERKVPHVSVADTIPLLAVEVISPTNTRQEMVRKRREFLERGTELFWIVDPRKQTVEVASADGSEATLTIDETLSGEPILPGFRLKIADWFGEAESAPPAQEDSSKTP